MGASGYIVFLLGMFITGQTKILEIGLYIAFYGIYFGILNKDTVDELSSRSKYFKNNIYIILKIVFSTI